MTKKKAAKKSEPKSRMSSRRAKRSDLRNLVKVLTEKQGDPDALFQRQVEIEEDPFRAVYREHRLRRPVYDFSNLYRIYEESDVLQSCVEAMQQNVDGFGYQLDFLGDDVKDKDKPQAKAEKMKAKNFFDAANETESWATIRKNMREDLEVIGNGGFEVIRNRRGQIAMMYHIPFQYVRLGLLEKEWQTVQVAVPRNGKMVNIRIKKRFRKFAQLNQYETTMRWFKEFGDKRIMDAIDGQYKAKASDCKMVASEIMHFKLPFGGFAYGFPRWIGVVLDVMGRRSAQYVNYDLFNSQGIPPLALMVSGGILNDDSVEELESMIRGMRGSEKWNRIALFESNPDTVGIEDRGNAKIELKNLAEYRKEDQMFDRYLNSTQKHIRHRFRLPPLYIGAAESFTHATSKSARAVAEEQVFNPERGGFDEVVNSRIMRQELGVTMWAYRSLGPKISNPEEVSKGVETFARAGAFSVNHAIERANEAFGLQMSKYDSKWADYPLGLVMKALELGVLNLDGLAEGQVPVVPDKGGKQRQGIPDDLRGGTAEKFLKSKMFSKKEKKLYKQMLLLQAAMETPDVSEEEDVVQL